LITRDLIPKDLTTESPMCAYVFACVLLHLW
jgi:hypothetical protein